MEWSEIEKLLKEKGYISKEDAAQLVAEKVGGAATKKDIDEAIRNFDAGASAVFFTGMPIAVKHFQEFNEVLDGPGLAKFMQDNRVADVTEAWNRMVAPKREEKRNADLAAERKKWEEEKVALEKKADERADEARKQALLEASAMRTPTDMTGPMITPFSRPNREDPNFKAPEGDPGTGGYVPDMMKYWMEKQRQKAGAVAN